MAALASLLVLGASAAEAAHPGIGRTPTAGEIAAWDIDVRPDFAGLPKGSGSVDQGQQIWDTRCASCHGTFGESNAVFNPLVGGTTADDLRTGRSKTLSSSAPNRTALSLAPTVATLWDYIHRAMPWNAPKSLGSDEVYAVLAYLLNLGDILPSDFVLSDRNIREVQDRMPNRDGMVRFPGLWDRRGRPDVHNVACMSNCASEVSVLSSLPEFARNSHGNLALQNRDWGAIRGADTEPASAGPRMAAASAKPSAAGLAGNAGCLACHGLASRVVGPGFGEVAERYRGDAGAAVKLMAKVRSGGSGNWGQIPMPPQTAIADEDLRTVLEWILAGATG